MFCAECGTKNESGAQFCENCGHKLEENVVTHGTTGTPKTGKSLSTKIQEMSKKNKIISVIAIFVVIVLIIGYFVLCSMTDPKNIAEKFFNATMSYDVDAMYSFLDIESSEFTTKEMFKKINKDDIDEDDIPKVLNYTVGKPVTSSDGLSTIVTITYVLDGEDESDTADIKLVKDKNKKWLFFDNWKIHMAGTDTVKGYQIKVMKDAKVTIEGVEVDKKYIDKKESSDSLDVYTMPAMFGTSYDIVITLPIGEEIEDYIYVSKGSSYTYKLSLSNLSDDIEDKVSVAVKTNLQTLYDGAKDQKSFDDIKSSFDYKGANLDDLKDAYEDLVDDISDDITLTKIEFKDVTLNSVNIDENGNLYVSFKVTYDYSLSYQSGDETKTHDSNDYDYMNLTFDYVDDAFKLVDASDLNTYFSRYY